MRIKKHRLFYVRRNFQLSFQNLTEQELMNLAKLSNAYDDMSRQQLESIFITPSLPQN